MVYLLIYCEGDNGQIYKEKSYGLLRDLLRDHVTVAVVTKEDVSVHGIEEDFVSPFFLLVTDHEYCMGDSLTIYELYGSSKGEVEETSLDPHAVAEWVLACLSLPKFRDNGVYTLHLSNDENVVPKKSRNPKTFRF